MNDTASQLSMEGRVALIFYNTIVVIFGLGGNILILFGSLMYKAIDMDKISVLLLENVAAADFLLIFALYLPKLVTLFTDKWDFGQGLCTFTGFLKYAPAACEIFIIMVTGFHRLYRLVKPLARRGSIVKYRILVAFIWFISLLFSLLWGTTGTIAKFEVVRLQCNPSIDESVINSVFRMIFICVLFIPMCIIVITNLLILYIVHLVDRRVRRAVDSNDKGTPSRKAVLTISLVCWTFILSYAPLLVYYAVALSGYKLPGWFQIVSSYTVSFNNIVNPAIYTLTNKRFAMFMRGLMKGKMDALRSMITVTNTVTATSIANVQPTADIILENISEVQS